MINILDKSNCTGCGACRDMCPTGAICLCADEEGFLYPQVDESKCIACNKCDNQCPLNKAQQKNTHENKMVVAYAAQSKNEQIRNNSSSGGVFSEIATYILEQNGIVFGAAFDEDLKVRHIGIESLEELGKLRGSKYVQSEIGDSYRRAQDQLEAGRWVLFTGTPCQIGGLLAYLKRDYGNLITQDIICHGVPSPMVWQKYLRFRENKAKAKAQRMSFRDKKPGWRIYSVRLGFGDDTEYVKVHSEDLYMKAFLKNFSLRPSCYKCAFKTKSRPSDITLADFWGVEHVVPEMDDNKGTSLVLIHSDKGRTLFDTVRGNLKWRETDVEESIKYNSAMISSVPLNKDRGAFISVVAQKGFKYGKKYLRDSLAQELKRVVKKVLGR